MSDDFDVLLAVEPLRLKHAPADLDQFAAAASGYMERAIITETLPHLILLTFSGAELRTWTLRGSPPAPIDDIVRDIVAHAQCEALALVHALPVPPEVAGDRAVNIAVETPHGAVDVLYALRGHHGEPDATYQIYQRPRGGERRWLGVASSVHLQMYRKDDGFGNPPAGEA